MEEAVRISKILSELGLCSRREADNYIEQGLVMLDGKIVTELGTRAYRSQKVELKKQASLQQSSKATVILNKPIGYISHLDDDKVFKPAASLITQDNFQVSKQHFLRSPRFNTDGLAPAGRLDIDSSGLLVLTQDGRIAKTIIGEQSVIEKEYLVRVEGKLIDNGLELLRHGLSLDGYKLKRAEVEWQNRDQLRFVLTEGRNRQIRRMCELVGLHVTGLKRVRIGNVLLGDLPLGMWRFLEEKEFF
ncbi:MAG: pseudouridine synthase [Methylococcales bacterium]|jgi:23S rRNA pseudouridine2604 synthase